MRTQTLVGEEEMAVVGTGDATLVSFVDDNVEQLQVAVLGVGVITLDVDTAVAGEPSLGLASVPSGQG